MSKAVQDAIEAARSAVAKTVQLSVGALQTAMSELTPDQIRAGFAMSPKEAPLWAHTAAGIAKGLIKSEQDSSHGPPAMLQVVIVGKAENNAAWLEMATPFAHRKAIEAAPVPVPVPVEKK